MFEYVVILGYKGIILIFYDESFELDGFYFFGYYDGLLWIFVFKGVGIGKIIFKFSVFVLGMVVNVW